MAEQDGVPAEEHNASVLVVTADAEQKEEEPLPPEGGAEQGDLVEAREGPDLGVEADGGHFNKNEDNRAGYGSAEDMQKSPPAVLDKPLDLGLGVEMEPSGWQRRWLLVVVDRWWW